MRCAAARSVGDHAAHADHDTEQGTQHKLGVVAFKGVSDYDDSKARWWSAGKSSNPAVAEVSADGVVTSTGSGKAQVTASVPGKSGVAVVATVDIGNAMVSAVEASGDFPAKFRLSSPPVTLKVLVKDEKGQIIDKPKVTFSATDYCVEATPDGIVHPLAVGSALLSWRVRGSGRRFPSTSKSDSIIFDRGAVEFLRSCLMRAASVARFRFVRCRGADCRCGHVVRVLVDERPGACSRAHHARRCSAIAGPCRGLRCWVVPSMRTM